jgi:Tfp pilus assembly protein PilN
MDEAAKVLERLERIEALGQERAPTSQLLDELRALVGEAEAWARLEGDERARDAVTRLRAAGSTAEAEGAAGAPFPIVSPRRGSGQM